MANSSGSGGMDGGAQLDYNHTKQKALQINLDDSVYGTFAEIGAGQEVARYFFQVGGASGTIAKSMSAYDMIFSDAIYGKEPSGRYVCESRLNKMITREFALLIKRLEGKRSIKTKFFAFANTVAASGHLSNKEGQGWIGVRFQNEPKGPHNDVILHVRLLDKRNLLQQQALGIIGVNLLHCAFYLHDQEEDKFVEALIEDLGPERIEIDMIKVVGPAFAKMDNRILSLQLVKKGVTNAVMFDQDGTVLQPSDILYKKNILALRGSFRPPTLVNMDMLVQGLEEFKREPGVQEDRIVTLCEITINNLQASGGEGGNFNEKDFLARVDLLGALGQKVLISNYQDYYKLAQYFGRYSQRKMGIVLGIFNLKEVFDPKSYPDLEGGILEALGKLFKFPLRMYVYPSKSSDGNGHLTCANLPMEAPLGLIFGYFLQQKRIVDIEKFDSEVLHIFSRRVLRMIQKGDSGWEKMVPKTVAKTVIEKKLFGHTSEY